VESSADTDPGAHARDDAEPDSVADAAAAEAEKEARIEN
jgi:hypothetical protein